MGSARTQSCARCAEMSQRILQCEAEIAALREQLALARKNSATSSKFMFRRLSKMVKSPFGPAGPGEPGAPRPGGSGRSSLVLGVAGAADGGGGAASARAADKIDKLGKFLFRQGALALRPRTKGLPAVAPQRAQHVRKRGLPLVPVPRPVRKLHIRMPYIVA